MKIQILQENLLKSLYRTTRLISAKTQLPVLQNVLMKTDEGVVKIVATNMETSITTYSRARVEKDGEVCVSAKLLSELVSTLPAETITLEAKEGALSVSGTHTRALLPGVPPAEFPPVEIEKNKKTEKIGKEEFINALSGLLFSSATDDGRPVLTGVRLVQDKSVLIMAATDGYRLSVKTIPIGKIAPEEGITVPAKALGEVVKIVQEEKEEKEIGIDFSDKAKAVFVIGETTVVTRLLEGEYPPYEKIIPKNHNTRAFVETDPFKRAVKSAALFARDSANIIRFHVGGGLITISANTPQVGENTVTVEADIDGEDADIAFNGRFLNDFLSNFKEERFVFEMTGSLNPGVFKPVDDDSYFHIIMPVRVQN